MVAIRKRKIKCPPQNILDSPTPDWNKVSDLDVDRKLRAVFDKGLKLFSEGVSRKNFVRDRLQSHVARMNGNVFTRAAGQEPLLEFGPERQLLHVTPKPGRKVPEKPNWNDVASHIDDYNFESEDLKNFLKIAHVPVEGVVNHAVNAGIFPETFRGGLDKAGRPWFHRMVIAIDGKQVSIRPKGGIGSKQSFQRPRAGGREEWAVDTGSVEYSNDIPFVIGEFIEELYRLLGNKVIIDGFNALVPGRVAGDAVSIQTKIAIKQLSSAAKSYQGKIQTNKNRIKVLSSVKGKLRGPKSIVTKQKAAMDTKITILKGDLGTLEASLTNAKEKLKQWRTEAAKERRRGAGIRPGEKTLPEPFGSGKYYPAVAVDSFMRQLKPYPHIRIGNTVYPMPTLAGDTVIKVLESGSNTNNIFRSIWPAGDESFVGLQGFSSFGMDPGRTLHNLATVNLAAADPKAYLERVDADAPWISDFIDDGGSWLGTNDLNEGLSTSTMQGTPGNPISTTQYTRAVDTFFKWTGIKLTREMWNRMINLNALDAYKSGRMAIDDVGEGPYKKAHRLAFGGTRKKLTTPEEVTTARQELTEGIMHLTGRLSRFEHAGQGPMLKLLVNALPFAGGWMWSQGALLSALLRSGWRGNIARRSVASWLMLAVGLTTLFASAFDNDLLDVFDITSPNFMSVRIPDSVPGMGGQYVGIGGPVQQLFRLAGKYIDRPDQWERITKGFGRGKAGPAISMGWDIITGESFSGKSYDTFADWAAYITSRVSGPFASFALQDVTYEFTKGLYSGKIKKGVKAAAHELRLAPGSIFGGRSYDVSAYTRLQDAKEAARKKLYPYVSGDYDQWARDNPDRAWRVERSPEVMAAQIRLSESDTDESSTDKYFDLIKDARADAFKRQSEEDDILQNSPKTYAPTWRKRQSALKAETFNKIDGAGAQAGIEFENRAKKGTVGWAVNKYYSIDLADPKYTDPLTNEIDHELFNADREEALQGFSASRRRSIQDYLDRYLTNLQLEYESALEKIEASGWWDLDEEAWELVRSDYDIEDRTVSRYRVRRAKEIENELGDDYVDTELRSDDILNNYGEYKSDLRLEWAETADHNIIRLLSKWGLNPISLAELGILGE